MEAPEVINAENSSDIVPSPPSGQRPIDVTPPVESAPLYMLDVTPPGLGRGLSTGSLPQSSSSFKSFLRPSASACSSVRTSPKPRSSQMSQASVSQYNYSSETSSLAPPMSLHSRAKPQSRGFRHSSLLTPKAGQRISTRLQTQDRCGVSISFEAATAIAAGIDAEDNSFQEFVQMRLEQVGVELVAEHLGRINQMNAGGNGNGDNPGDKSSDQAADSFLCGSSDLGGSAAGGNKARDSGVSTQLVARMQGAGLAVPERVVTASRHTQLSPRHSVASCAFPGEVPLSPTSLPDSPTGSNPPGSPREAREARAARKKNKMHLDPNLFSSSHSRADGDEQPAVTYASEASKCSSFAPTRSDAAGMGEELNFEILDTWVPVKGTLDRHPTKKRFTTKKARTAASCSIPEEELGFSSEFSDGGTLLRRFVPKTYIINPQGMARQTWDTFLILMIAWEATVIPIQLLEVQTPPIILIVDWVTRTSWAMDLMLSCITGYVATDGTPELRPAWVFKHYLNTWFPVDLCLVLIDWGELVFIGGGSSTATTRMSKTIRAVRLVKMMRISRLARIKRGRGLIQKSLECSGVRHEFITIALSIIKVILLFIWFNHLVACIWCAIASSETDAGQRNWVSEQSKGDGKVFWIYAESYHWALSMFVGNVETVPWSLTEIVFANVNGIIAFVLMAAVVSNITSLLTHLQMVTSQDSEKMAQLQHYLWDNRISTALSLRVQRGAQHALQDQRKNLCETSIELLFLISEPLRMDLHYEIGMPCLCAHPFFRVYTQVSKPLMRQVCHAAVSRLQLSSGDVLFNQGEVTQQPCMYVVLDGHMQYVHELGHSEGVTFGAWACEPCLWTCWAHFGSMIAQTETTLVVLEAARFQHASKNFSEDMKFSQQYAVAFVQALNELDVQQLTDVEEPDMELEWLVIQSCPTGSAELTSHGGSVARFLKQSQKNVGGMIGKVKSQKKNKKGSFQLPSWQKKSNGPLEMSSILS